MVTSTFPRWAGDGATPFIANLAQDLQALGWIVDILAPHAPGAATMETLDGLAVRRFRYLWPASAQTLCYQGGALANLRKHRVNLVKLPALVLAEWLATMRCLLSGRYDLVHSHWILPQGFTSALAAAPLRIPHVATVHGSDVFALRGAAFERFKRFALGAADAVTVNSSATEAAVRALKPGLANVHRIPMGVAPGDRPDRDQTARIQARLGAGAGPVAVFVGRLAREKGVDDLLRAAALLAGEMPNLRLLIVGDGPDRTLLQNLAGDLGIADRAVFAGWVAADALADYLAAASLFVGPSKRGHDGTTEGQGLVFAEALAAGLPVIATRLGGIVDVVRHGETGLLVDEGSPAQIAAAIRTLADDPAFAGRLASAGRALVMAGFTRAASAESFSAVYGACLTKRSGSVADRRSDTRRMAAR